MPAQPWNSALAASSQNCLADDEKNKRLAMVGAAGQVNRRTRDGRGLLDGAYDPLESDNRLRLTLARRRRRRVLAVACALDLLARAQPAQRAPSPYRQLMDDMPMDAEAIMARESDENFLLHFRFTKDQFTTLCDHLRVPAFFRCGAENKTYVGGYRICLHLTLLIILSPRTHTHTIPTGMSARAVSPCSSFS